MSALPRASRSGLETRDRILEAFVDLAADHGYHATAISDVASSAGVSKGAVLHHFGNKDGLLNAAGVTYIERRHVELLHAFDRLSDPADMFAAIVYTTILAERDDRAASRLFGREFSIFQHDPRLAHVREARGRYVECVREKIVQCMDAGLLRRDDPTIVLLQIYGMCNWTWTWYRPDGRLSAEEIGSRFARTLLRGLAVPGAVAEEPVVHDERIVELILQARVVA